VKVKSLLVAGVLTPAITAAIVLLPGAHANAGTIRSEYSTVVNCETGFASGSNVYGDHCGGYPPDGTYSNVFVAIESLQDYACATVKMVAQGIAASGTGCTPAEPG
jgi:hypothetical protein